MKWDIYGHDYDSTHGHTNLKATLGQFMTVYYIEAYGNTLIAPVR